VPLRTYNYKVFYSSSHTGFWSSIFSSESSTDLATFKTAKSASQDFNFLVQADSHTGFVSASVSSIHTASVALKLEYFRVLSMI
jgi:hypothetical protein